MVFQSRLGYNLHSTHRTTTLFDIRFQRQFSSFFFCNKRIQNNFKWKRQMSFASQRHPEMMEGFDDDYITSMIQKYTLKKQTSASLETLMRTGRGEYLHKTQKDEKQHHLSLSSSSYGDWKEDERVLMQVASFIRHELPIRLARRINDLENVPYMCDMPSVQQVKQTYIQSFLDIINTPVIDTTTKEEEFSKMLQSLYSKHSNVLMQMAKGAYELRAQIQEGNLSLGHQKWKQSSSSSSSSSSPPFTKKDHNHSNVEFDEMEEMNEFLNRFYMSRIGIRVMVGQYLSLRQPPMDGWIGLVYDKVSPATIVRQAVEDATMICNRRYGDAPDVEISGRLDLTFPYLPDHLHYILLELLKNSMRATMDWHVDGNNDGAQNHSNIPPVRVIIADGNENEDVVIKVSDEGGGIQRSNSKKIWSYLYTTADPAIQEGMVAFQNDHSTESPLAGLGYGLPISRSYTRYFGGDLDIMSMEGYGTDAFVHLCRLGNSQEPLPL